jgi:hypothetical protein
MYHIVPKVTLQYQTTSFGTMSKARCTKHVLPSWCLKTVDLGVRSRDPKEILLVWTSND